MEHEFLEIIKVFSPVIDREKYVLSEKILEENKRFSKISVSNIETIIKNIKLESFRSKSLKAMTYFYDLEVYLNYEFNTNVFHKFYRDFSLSPKLFNYKYLSYFKSLQFSLTDSEVLNEALSEAFSEAFSETLNWLFENSPINPSENYRLEIKKDLGAIAYNVQKERIDLPFKLVSNKKTIVFYLKKYKLYARIYDYSSYTNTLTRKMAFVRGLDALLEVIKKAINPNNDLSKYYEIIKKIQFVVVMAKMF